MGHPHPRRTQPVSSCSAWRGRRRVYRGARCCTSGRPTASACDNFDVLKVSKYDDADVERLLGNAGIIRNRLKINAMINNANRFLETQEEFGTFDNVISGSSRAIKTLRAAGVLTWDRVPATSSRVERHVQGPQEAGIQICWKHHLLRFHAVDSHGQRSRFNLLPGP